MTLNTHHFQVLILFGKHFNTLFRIIQMLHSLAQEILL